MIEYIKGDLFAAGERVIAHGCNCQGVMGAGVARIVRTEFENVYDYYKEACNMGWFYPGVVMPVDSWNGNQKTLIYNLATQDQPGANARYLFVERAMQNMLMSMNKRRLSRVAMPKIGCGIGGLDWEVVEDIIKQTFPSPFGIQVVVYEL